LPRANAVAVLVQLFSSADSAAHQPKQPGGFGDRQRRRMSITFDSRDGFAVLGVN